MEEQRRELPINVLVVGLAGSGKSTLLHCINQHVYDNNILSYFVNLDPATADLDFSANIDIRDSVNYDSVMQSFNLGPNGAILTSLNLFATSFHDVVKIAQETEGLNYVFYDTPGQIEAFAWSASGGLITEALASTFKTVVLFVVDVPRCTKTATFVSTMLYACSVLYRSGVPMVLALTKTDVTPADEILEWLRDVDKFEDAVANEKDDTYFSDFVRSAGDVMSELYKTIPFVGVSGRDGRGVSDLLEAIKRVSNETPPTQPPSK